MPFGVNFPEFPTPEEITGGQQPANPLDAFKDWSPEETEAFKQSGSLYNQYSQHTTTPESFQNFLKMDPYHQQELAQYGKLPDLSTDTNVRVGPINEGTGDPLVGDPYTSPEVGRRQDLYDNMSFYGAPWATGGGATDTTGSPAPDESPSPFYGTQSYALTQPGAGERWNDATWYRYLSDPYSRGIRENIEQMGGPGQSQDFYATAFGQGGAGAGGMRGRGPESVMLGGHMMGMGDVTQRLGRGTAGERFQRGFAGRRPDVGMDAGLDPYYDRAKQRAMSDIERETAALGAYGSSAGQDLKREALTDLAAEQANREADFRMRQLAEERGWEGLGGQLAGQAGAQQLGRDAAMRQWDVLGGQLAGQAGAAQRGWTAQGAQAAQAAETADFMRDQAVGQAFNQLSHHDLQRLVSGQNTAATAQMLQETRERYPFMDTLQVLQTIMPTVASAMGSMTDTDLQLLMQGIDAGLAGTKQAVSESERRREDVKEGADTVMEMSTTKWGGGGGGGM
jgi:hypothetical protein